MTAVGILQGTSDQTFIEHRYSVYTKTQGLAVTFGHPAQITTPEAGLGVLQDKRTIARCFSCHSTIDAGGSRSALSPAPVEMGVRCERCHGPGAAHVEAAQARRSPADLRKALLNPGRLPPRGQIEVCGACHRLPTPDLGDEPELAEPVTVRFAPVGLMASRCFRESKTLSCLTCHNPHSNLLPASDPSYREECLSCHTGVQNVRLCRRAEKGECLSCHMRKAALGPYLSFTDHRIRVYPEDRHPRHPGAAKSNSGSGSD